MEALDVLAAFGATGWVGLLFTPAPGDVEFVVCRCRLVTSVTVQTWRATVELPSRARCGEVLVLPARMTFAQVAEALAAADCQWELLNPTEGQRGWRAVPAGGPG